MSKYVVTHDAPEGFYSNDRFAPFAHPFVSPTHTSMTAVEQATGKTSRDALPPPEAEPPSQQPVAMQQDWGYHMAMPRLSEVVPGWNVDVENHNPIDEGDGLGEGEGMDKDSRIPPHRRKVVRTRAAPAGPHPYLDRFASGMHRPLEGSKYIIRCHTYDPFSFCVSRCVVGKKRVM